MLLDFPKNVKVLTETTVLKIDREKSALLSGEGTGLRRLRFEEFILASGCREIAAGGGWSCTAHGPREYILPGRLKNC